MTDSPRTFVWGPDGSPGQALDRCPDRASPPWWRQWTLRGGLIVLILLGPIRAVRGGATAPMPFATGAAMSQDETVAAALDRLLVAGSGSPAERVRWARSVADALPAAEIARALPLLGDADAEIRSVAVGLAVRPDLGAIARPERVAALVRLSEIEPVARVRAQAVQALATTQDPVAYGALSRICSDGEVDVAVVAASALAGGPGAGPYVASLVRRGAFAEAGAPRAEVMGRLLPAYGQWLGDQREVDRGLLTPLVLCLRHPHPLIRAGAGRAFDGLVDRLIDAPTPGRALELLGELQEMGIGREVALYQRARIALGAEGQAGEALAAADALVDIGGIRLGSAARSDAFASQLWRFRGLHLRGLAELALGRPGDAEVSLGAAALALDRALAERRDLRSASERERHVDLLHQRALVAVARIAVAIARGEGDAEILALARGAHTAHLEAQAVYAELEGDVLTGWDALLGSDLSPYRLLFGRRGFQRKADADALGRSELVRIQGQLGRALATVSPGELPGFAPLFVPGLAGRITDPLEDPARRAYLERIREARLGSLDSALDEAEGALMRARDRAPGILPEDEIDRIERLRNRQRVALRDLEQLDRSDTKWVRDLRIPGSAGLWFAQDLTEEGRGAEAREVAARAKADIEARGISNWWFYLGHERVARAQLLVGSSYTDEGNGEKAEEALLEAVARIEDVVRQLKEGGASEGDVAAFRTLEASALVSLAVNANVRLGDVERAEGYYERAYAIRKDEFMRVLLACYRARSGAEVEARALIRTIRPGPGTWYNLACTHALLGDTDRALEYLEAELRLNHASQDSRNRQREWAASDPDLARLRGDARFERLVRPR